MRDDKKKKKKKNYPALIPRQVGIWTLEVHRRLGAGPPRDQEGKEERRFCTEECSPPNSVWLPPLSRSQTLLPKKDVLKMVLIPKKTRFFPINANNRGANPFQSCSIFR